MSIRFNRRGLLAAGAAAGAAAALGAGPATAARSGGPYDKGIAPAPASLAPKMVQVRADYPAGELHVDPNFFTLYITRGAGMALAYKVGVGRKGLYEPGTFYVGAKVKWPQWRPTDDMIEREPEHYKQYEDGMDGGPDNPLGARALYLFYPGKGDSMLRIHGTNAPRTIGTAVSNGCARLVNAQIVEVYKMVPIGTKVVLHPKWVA